LNGPDVRALYHHSPVDTPPDVEAFVGLWRMAQQQKFPPSGLAQVSFPPSGLADRIARLQETEVFKTQYEPFGGKVVSFDLRELITPQWWVDLDYVQELSASLNMYKGDKGLYDFCFPTSCLERPFVAGNGVVLSSGRRDLGRVTPLRLEHFSPEKATISFDVFPRPNFVFVARLQETQKILILNGVHHLLALLSSGSDRAIGVLRDASVAETFNFAQDPSIFKPNRLMSPRPPLLRDYLDHAVVTKVDFRPMNQFMRFGLSNPELSYVPRLL